MWLCTAHCPGACLRGPCITTPLPSHSNWDPNSCNICGGVCCTDAHVVLPCTSPTFLLLVWLYSEMPCTCTYTPYKSIPLARLPYSPALVTPRCSFTTTQLGHQAVTCPNGTIDWRAVYGDKTFILRPPLYSDQWKSLMEPLPVDIDAIAKQAEEYGKVCCR